jgi:hypothetical protein
MEMIGWLQAPALLPSDKEFQYPFIGGWDSPGVGLNVVEKRKSLTPTGVRTPDRPPLSIVALPTALLRFMQYEPEYNILYQP